MLFLVGQHERLVNTHGHLLSLIFCQLLTKLWGVCLGNIERAQGKQELAPIFPLTEQ